MPHTRLYQDGKLIAEDFPAAEVSDHLEDPSSVVWLDLCLEHGDKLETVLDGFEFFDGFADRFD